MLPSPSTPINQDEINAMLLKAADKLRDMGALKLICSGVCMRYEEG